jgi:hypothetical protein
VTLLRPGGIPKPRAASSNGSSARRRLGDGPPSDVARAARVAPAAPAAETSRRAPAVRGPAPVDRRARTARADRRPSSNWLRDAAGAGARVQPRRRRDEEPFARCGLDSAVAVTLTGELAEWLRLDLDSDGLLGTCPSAGTGGASGRPGGRAPPSQAIPSSTSSNARPLQSFRGGGFAAIPILCTARCRPTIRCTGAFSTRGWSPGTPT